MKRLFFDEGLWVEHASTVFPSITGAGLPAVLTGSLPARHGIPSLYFFDRQTAQYPVLYALLEALDWNQWLSPEAKTIWEHFPGGNDTMAIGPALNRGADSVVPVIWNLNYKPMEYRAQGAGGPAQVAARVLRWSAGTHHRCLQRLVRSYGAHVGCHRPRDG